MISFVVLDKTVLTNFALVNRPDLIERLWPGVAVTTSSAMREYQAGVLSHRLPENCWDALPIVDLSSEEINHASRLPKNLGEGERTCLSVAKIRGGALATDDLAARRRARQHAVPITGTVGILMACVQNGLVTLHDGNQILSRMIASGFRSPIQRLD